MLCPHLPSTIVVTRSRCACSALSWRLAGLFINTDMGSAFLMSASRMSVGDLNFAHRIWELLIRSRRVPDRVCHLLLSSLQT